jgi:hypothetical protein
LKLHGGFAKQRKIHFMGDVKQFEKPNDPATFDKRRYPSLRFVPSQTKYSKNNLEQSGVKNG